MLCLVCVFDLPHFICRGKNQVKASCDGNNWTTEMDSQASGSAADAVDINNNESGSGKVGESEPEGALCLQDRLKWLEQHVVRKVVLFPKDYPFTICFDMVLKNKR